MEPVKIDFYFKEYSEGTFEYILNDFKYLDLQPKHSFFLSDDESRAEEDALFRLMVSILHLDFDTVKHLNLYDTLSMYYFDTVDNNEDTIERKGILDKAFTEHRFILTKKTYYKKDMVSIDFTVVHVEDEPTAYNGFTGHDF